MSTTAPYVVLIQAVPEEILSLDRPEESVLGSLMAHGSVKRVVVAMPNLEGSRTAVEKLHSWGVDAMVGSAVSEYNVCLPLLEATSQFADGQDFVVRILIFWTNIDLEYVDRQVECMRSEKHDFVTAPLDFEVTLCADVASCAALEKISRVPQRGASGNRMLFNPFGYMDSNPELFSVMRLEPAPMYTPEVISKILGTPRRHPENELIGRDFSGGRYHFLLESGAIPDGMTILDMACGSGYGTHALAQRASLAVGCDYLSAYVEKAKADFPETAVLKFFQGDGATFLYNNGGFFDVVVTLHTLEHVPSDVAMLANNKA